MEQRDNSFVLFRNKDKKNPKGPDWSGHGIVNGQHVFVDAWDKDAGRGVFLSGAFKNKNQHNTKQEPRNDDPDSIPF